MTALEHQELKICPFCGKDASLLVIVDPYVTSYISYDFYVSCNACGSQGPIYSERHNSDIRIPVQSAIEEWNKRI